MRLGGPLPRAAGTSPRGSRVQAGAGQVALQGALTGGRALGELLAQEHAQQPGAPAGVLLAQLHGGGEQVGIGGGLVLAAAVVVGAQVRAGGGTKLGQ